MTRGPTRGINVLRLPTLGDMEKLGNLAIDTATKVPDRIKSDASNGLGLLDPRAISERRPAWLR